MNHLIRSAIVVAGAAVLAAARTHAAPNPLSVVVGNGPYAGTYSAKADEVVCLHSKTPKMYAASFRDAVAKGPRALAEAGLKVDNPDAPGAKTGELHVAFGSSDKHAVEYDIYGVSITMTPKGKGADLGGAGKTKDGIQIRITASCVDVETM